MSNLQSVEKVNGNSLQTLSRIY